MEDPAIFNDGLLDTINNDYLSGPYEVDNWDSAQKVLTVVPNENWWGRKAPARPHQLPPDGGLSRPYANPSAYINAGWVKE